MQAGIKNILYATDLSVASIEAKGYALTLARALGSKLYVLYVLDILLFAEIEPYGFPIGELKELRYRRAQAELEKLCGGPEWQGIEVEPMLKEGNPAAEIIKVAEEKSVDLIVIGAYGKTGISGVLFGSTAERVARKSRCPVMVVKASEAHTE